VKPSDPIPAGEVRRALEDVLDAPRSRDEPTLLEELLEWLDELASESGVSDTAVEITLWIVVGLVVVLLVLLLGQALSAALRAERRPRDAADLDRGPSARERAARLRREALAAREAGDRRLALRLGFFALVVGLGARGNLRYRDAWTNRELLHRGRPGRAELLLLSPLVDDLEAKDFGREPVTDEDLDRLETLCTKHLGRLPEEVT
jgi:hypothetical protein